MFSFSHQLGFLTTAFTLLKKILTDFTVSATFGQEIKSKVFFCHFELLFQKIKIDYIHRLAIFKIETLI